MTQSLETEIKNTNSDIYSPVYVMGDNIGNIQLIQHTGNDKIVVNSARVSYGQDNNKPFDKKDGKLLKYLLEHNHSSVLEHTYVTFAVEAPQFVFAQWVRHRLSSFNAQSFRYTEVKEDLFYVPKPRLQHKVNKQASMIPAVDSNGNITFTDLNKQQVTMPHEIWESAINSIYLEAYDLAMKRYNELLNLGVAREIARVVIPNGQYTRFYYSANLRSLLHFCDLRLAEGAQLEIRWYAQAIMNTLSHLFPETVAAWEELRQVELSKQEELEKLRKLLEEISGTVQSISTQMAEIQG